MAKSVSVNGREFQLASVPWERDVHVICTPWMPVASDLGEGLRRRGRRVEQVAEGIYLQIEFCYLSDDFYEAYTLVIVDPEVVGQWVADDDQLRALYTLGKIVFQETGYRLTNNWLISVVNEFEQPHDDAIGGPLCDYTLRWQTYQFRENIQFIIRQGHVEEQNLDRYRLNVMLPFWQQIGGDDYPLSQSLTVAT